jgi:ribosome-associated toxin RatA of RatAB toxin-antitoxin module
MRYWVTSLTRQHKGAWIFLLGAGIFISLWLAPYASAQDEIRTRLEAGEVIVSTEKVPGTSVKRGEIMGLVDAPPKIVWQVITDINNFKYFMPRTLNSMAIAAEKLALIMQSKPRRAKEVEKLLGPVPADPASYCIPGGKYVAYLYSHLDFPWPASNRWYIIKLLQDETRAVQDSYLCSWSLVTGNLRENSGEWILEPCGTNKTKVIYRLCTDPGGAVPGFLVKRGTSNTMPQIIEAVRKRAASLCESR